MATDVNVDGPKDEESQPAKTEASTQKTEKEAPLEHPRAGTDIHGPESWHEKFRIRRNKRPLWLKVRSAEWLIQLCVGFGIFVDICSM